MGSFKIITKNELRYRKRMTKDETELFDKFKEHISKIGKNEAAVYELADGEDIEKCKKLIRMASRALDSRIRVVEEKNSLVFYRTARTS
jgi:hypothetical protein